MQSEHGTYQSLIVLERDIDAQCKASTAFAFLNRKTIKSFYQNNQYRLKACRNHLNDFLEQHVQKDEKGEFVKEKDENGIERYVFKTDADKAFYQQKLDTLMNQQIDIYH